MPGLHFLKPISFFTALLAVPFFVFAQTSPSELTPAEIDQIIQQAMKDPMVQAAKESLDAANLVAQQARDAEAQLRAFTQEQLKLIPTPAQIRTNAIRDYLDVKYSPQNPGPAEVVTVTVESYLSDLNKAMMTWSINGKVVERGMGKLSFSFKNGDSGETTTLSVSIVTNTEERVLKEFIFNPVGMILLWEADTYTPPFYKGKSLLTPQARVRAVAIPDSINSKNALDAGNLSYVWKQDDETVSEASGYGKNSFSFVGPMPFGETRVSVAASSLNDTIKSELKLFVPLQNPFILFYENFPLLGVWYNRPLGKDVALSKKEISVSAVPFFFSNGTNGTSSLVYNWGLNGSTVPNSGRAITLRNNLGEVGNSLLTLTMRNMRQTFQSNSQSLNINFTADESARPTF